ncbi:hypothetical protein NPIL_235631 [Nephila pilipes]|uniref:Uncharacterized protein n=1 Tax=Nephila pilipes TaxID=299642 RepID=A0A8X6IZN0_NEPPI|nr:hypothetical protein NPIL_235631 [Nephila pilipes]
MYYPMEFSKYLVKRWLNEVIQRGNESPPLQVIRMTQHGECGVVSFPLFPPSLRGTQITYPASKRNILAARDTSGREKGTRENKRQ